MWERACSRMRRTSQHHLQVIHRYREQAHSYIGSVLNPSERHAPLTRYAICSAVVAQLTRQAHAQRVRR